MAAEEGRDTSSSLSHIDLSKPRYDQSTYSGRARHFIAVTNPLNVLATPAKLEAARQLVLAHRNGTLPKSTTEGQLWKAKNLYDSAFHPDTGEKMLLVGRMSFQVPGNMTITGCMLTFYRTPAATIFWQWANQSFNAGVNYTNRSGDSLTLKQLMVPYLSATTGAVGTALVLNKVAKSLPSLVGRCVPFVAVAAANCINIPFMRQTELKEGIVVTDKDGNELGRSKVGAKLAIAMVILSRIGMAMPAMLFPPVVMDRLDRKYPVLRARPGLQAMLQVSMVGVCLAFATPLCCALFPQQSSLKVAKLEADLQERLRSIAPGIDRVYFNKGL